MEMDLRNNQRFNKKRKSFGTYLKWERYQGKRRRFGQGTHIGEDTFNYLIRIMEVKISDFSTAEDREIFIDNFFEQTAGREIEISSNQVGSRAIEMFLPWANDKILLRFTYALSKDLMEICCHEFASHVMQKLIIVVSAQLQKIQSIDSEKEASQESPLSTPEMSVRFKNWLQQVSKFVIDNFEELMWETYANHVIRTVLECLSGLPPGSISREKKWDSKEWVPGPEAKTSPIDEGFSLVQECGSCVLKMPQIFENIESHLISGLLQTVLATVRKVDKKLSRKIVCRLLDDYFDPELPDCLPPNSTPKILTSQAATHLMDIMIRVAKKKTFTQIHTRCFKNKLQVLSLAHGANLCVQNLIRHCKEKLEFESIFEELNPNFDALLRNKKHGVLLALGQACQRFRCKQGDFMKQLRAAFHCVQPEGQVLFPLLVAHLVDYDTWCQINGNENDSRKLSITVPGSLLVQTMLNFMEPIKIVRALLEMDCKHLVNLLCHCNGCYVGDALLDSQTIGEKQRKIFFRKLQGSFVALAVSKCGSRILDKLWLWASLKDKKLILGELASSEAIVMSVTWGKIFAHKKGLSLFKRRPDDWEESLKRITQAEKLFADIIDT